LHIYIMDYYTAIKMLLKDKLMGWEDFIAYYLRNKNT
jgi:hypothetical protein